MLLNWISRAAQAWPRRSITVPLAAIALAPELLYYSVE